MNFAQFAEQIDNIYQETMSTDHGEDEVLEPSADAADEIHEVVLKVFRKCPRDLRRILGTLFSMALVDDTIFEIETIEDLKAKLGEITATQMQQFSVSSDVARKILGYGVRTEVYDGKKHSVYYPTEGCGMTTRGATFVIPEIYREEKVDDTFPYLLLTACLKMAEDFGIKDALTPSDDMDRYTATEKGGKYRSLSVVKADADGNLICKDEGTLSVYDLDNVRRITLITEAGDKSYPFCGQLVDYFVSMNLIVNPNGPHKLGDGVLASGPYDPASFMGGVPDATLETLVTVMGLMNVDKNQFIKRYNSFLKNPQAKKPAASTKEEKKSPKPPPAAKSAIPPRPEVYVSPPMRGGRGAARGGFSSRGARGWASTMRKSVDPNCSGDKTEEESTRRREEDRQSQQTYKTWSNLEEKAVAALIWLRNKNGCQLNALEQKFADIHGYAYDIIAYIGKGSRRAELINYIRSISKQKQMTIADAASQAAEKGLLPPIILSDGKEEFDASDTLVFVLALLKICASIKFVRRDGLRSVFHWDTNNL